jgi:geranylgeranyl pyrophosphate synthase
VGDELLDLSQHVIREFISSSPEIFKPILTEILLHNGKKMRPQIVNWLTEAIGQSEEFKNLNRKNPSQSLLTIASQVGACIESIHCASLVLDDIHDGSKTRRNAPCAHLVHGIPWAMNAANWLLFSSCQFLSKDSSKLLVVKALQDCHFGQALDILNSSPTHSKELLSMSAQDRWERYCECVELKTSRLLELAFELVCNEIFNTPEEFQSKYDTQIRTGFRMYGRAFQMLDDLKNFSNFESNLKEFEDLEACCRSSVFLEWFSLLEAPQSEAISQIALTGKQALAATMLTHEKFPVARDKLKNLAHECMELSEKSLRFSFLNTHSQQILKKILFHL